MESRAFGTGRGRTFFKEIHLTTWDIIALIVTMASLSLGIFITVSGYGHYQYYPTLGNPDISAIGWLLTLFLVILLISIVPLAEIRQRTSGD
jgi:uncharacterized membrane protein